MKSLVFALLAGTVLSSQVSTQDWATIEEGTWGIWTQSISARSGYYGCGAQLRQDSSGVYGAVGLQLKFCKLEDWNDQYWQLIEGGTSPQIKQEPLYWKYVMCPDGQFIRGAQVQRQSGLSLSGGDDSRINNLRILCGGINGEISGWLNVGDDRMGNWKSSVDMMAMNFLVAAKVRMDYTSGPAAGIYGIKFDYADAAAPENKEQLQIRNPLTNEEQVQLKQMEAGLNNKVRMVHSQVSEPMSVKKNLAQLQAQNIFIERPCCPKQCCEPAPCCGKPECPQPCPTCNQCEPCCYDSNLFSRFDAHKPNHKPAKPTLRPVIGPNGKLLKAANGKPILTPTGKLPPKKRVSSFGHWHLVDRVQNGTSSIKQGIVARPSGKVYNEAQLSNLQHLISVNYKKGNLFYEYPVPTNALRAVQNEATRLPGKQGLTWQLVDCGADKADSDYWYIWQWVVERDPSEGNGFKFYGTTTCTEADIVPKCPPGGCKE